MKPDPVVDRSLWFLHLGCTGRHYLLGNPHTVPGRMLAWCPKERRSLFVAKADICEASKSARYWIEGFLRGSEPAPPAGEDGVPDYRSREHRAWERQVAKFHDSGVWRTPRRK